MSDGVQELVDTLAGVRKDMTALRSEFTTIAKAVKTANPEAIRTAAQTGAATGVADLRTITAELRTAIQQVEDATKDASRAPSRALLWAVSALVAAVITLAGAAGWLGRGYVDPICAGSPVQAKDGTWWCPVRR